MGLQDCLARSEQNYLIKVTQSLILISQALKNSIVMLHQKRLTIKLLIFPFVCSIIVEKSRVKENIAQRAFTLHYQVKM